MSENRDQRLQEELAHHRQQLESDYVARGLSPEAARREAARRLGGEDQIRERHREASRWSWLGDVRRDVALAVRLLRRTPGFTAVVIISLALGIGANAALFSILDAAMWHPLPVDHPGQVVLLGWQAPKWPRALGQSGAGGPAGPGVGSYSLAYPTYASLRDHNAGTLSAVFGFAPVSYSGPSTEVVVAGQAHLAGVQLVTGQFFSGLGLAPARGRLLTPQDEQSGAPLAAVMSYAYWTSNFARDPSIIGTTITVNHNPVVLAGIAPRGFQGVQPGSPDDLWLSLTPALPANLLPWGYQPPGQSLFQTTSYWWLQVMARRQPGVTMAQAQAALRGSFHALTLAGLSPTPKPDHMPQLVLETGAMGMNGFGANNAQMLWILMGIVGVLLLLACANVAALLLARATARQRETTIRLALGARRARLVRQLLTESLLLALLGGAAGALLAPWAVHALLALLGGSSSVPLAVHLDWNIVLFTLAVALMTGLLFGLAPALRSTRNAAATGLRRSSSDRSRLRGDKFLAGAQVALSLVLLVGAGLFLRTLLHLQAQPLGFQADHLLVFGLDGTEAGYQGQRLEALYRQSLERLQSLPAVSGATASRLGLLTGWTSSGSLQGPGLALTPTQAIVNWNAVGPHFLATLGIPLLRGRDLSPQDFLSPEPVAIINQTLARRIFGRADPLGREVTRAGRNIPLYRIVGVSGDARYDGLKGVIPPTLYLPYTQTGAPVSSLTFEVRYQGSESAAAAAIRTALHDLDPALIPSGMRTMLAQRADLISDSWMFAELAAFFALLGLVLAAIGIEGTMAYTVTQRSGEIGVRMALGAQRGQVLGAVLREALVVAATGAALGLVAALFLARLLASQLFGVQPSDPWTLITAVGVLLLAALGAAFLPANRASRLDPVRALRAE